MPDLGSVLAALLAALVGVLSPGGGPPSDDEPGVPGTNVSDPRPFTKADALRVAAGPGGTKVLRTADGRTVRLRGANVNALVDYAGVHRTVPVTEQDGRQARALGFDVVRLAVSWSRIAPSGPGAYDEAYLDDVRRSARAFTDQGVYVLLDLHQDRYAAGLGRSGDESDGAPAWAAKTDGASTLAGSSGHPYYGTEASRVAARNFFANAEVAGKGLQEHYADAIARLAGVGAELGPGLAGVELFNEPIDPDETDPLAPDTFSAERLWPLYDRLIERLRSDDGLGPRAGAYEGPIWFEPTATRTQTDRDAAASRYTSAAFADPSLVYGPHIYTDVFGTNPDDRTPAKLAASFDAAATEAQAYGAALAPTELPGANGGPRATGTEVGVFDLHRAAVLQHLDRLGAGGIVWVWKQHGAPGTATNYGWGVLNADGSARTDSNIAHDYGRPRVRAAEPAILEHTWSSGVLTVRTSGAGVVDLWDGASFARTPPAVGTAPEVAVDGTRVPAAAWRAHAALQDDTRWVGGRQLRITVPAGEHRIVLGPPGTTPGGSPAAPDPAPAGGPDGPTAVGPSASSPTGTTPLDASPTGTVATPGRPSVGSAGTPRGAGSGSTPTAITARVAGLSVSPRRFRPASGSRHGTRLRILATGATRVRVVLQRSTTGVRRGGRCVAASRGRTGAARCAAHTTVETSRATVARGSAAVRLTGRSGRRALRPGRYRLVVSPFRADGARGPARTATVTVLRPAR